MSETIDPSAKKQTGPTHTAGRKASSAGQSPSDAQAPPGPEVAAALLELEAARIEVEAAIDGVTDATKRALDLPAKVRRNPLRSAALVGGAGFLLAGGPRRVLRFALGKVRTEERDPHAGLLPDEVEKVLRDSGLARDPEIRRALDEDFADYLRKKGRYGPEPTPSVVLWRTFDRLAGPLGTAGARILVQRIMSAEQDREAARAELRAASRARTRDQSMGKRPT